MNWHVAGGLYDTVLSRPIDFGIFRDDAPARFYDRSLRSIREMFGFSRAELPSRESGARASIGIQPDCRGRWTPDHHAANFRVVSGGGRRWRESLAMHPDVIMQHRQCDRGFDTGAGSPRTPAARTPWLEKCTVCGRAAPIPEVAHA